MSHEALFTCYDINVYYGRSGLFFSLAKERLVVYPFELGVIVLCFLVYFRENKGEDN